MMKNPKFQVFMNRIDKEFYFHLKSVQSGEIILSGEGYTSKQSCMAGVQAIQDCAGDERNYQRRDAHGNYTFNLRGHNREIIGRSENYVTLLNRELGLAAVKRDAPVAGVEDLTMVAY
jgi:uncharacterized protein YegP (UPF0339 family)